MVRNPELATRLALQGQVLNVPKDALLFDCDEAADGAYVVRYGRVQVFLLNENKVPVWGRGLSDFSIIGLPAALGRYPHYFRAVTLEDSELVFVPVQKISELITKNPVVGYQVLSAISEELNDVRRKALMLKARVRLPAV
jgi:CRP-like cAMP-binding protein